MADWTDIFGSVTGGLSGIANIGVGAANITAQKKIAAENRAMQREFAQNSIQWRVNDAKKAGLHPLYALGANGTSYTPQSLDSFGYSQIADGVKGIASSFQNYNIAKNQRLQNELLTSQIEAQKLQNQALKNSMAQVSKQMEKIAPAIADVPNLKKTKLPYGYDTVQPEASYQLLPSDEQYGLVGKVPSKDMVDWYSEGILNQFQWHVRNSNPFRNPFTEADVGKFASDLAKAGAPIENLDIIQEFSGTHGWTMRAVPKGVPANAREKIIDFIRRKAKDADKGIFHFYRNLFD